jgi:hypothetical protein
MIFANPLNSQPLGGAIGCDYSQDKDQLWFVEYNGKITNIRMDSYHVKSIVSSGTATIRGTWSFDFDAGQEVGSTPERDVFWHQHTAVKRTMDPMGSAKIAYVGVVNFNTLTPDKLSKLYYSDTPINGNNDASNKLVNGAVFAVLTNDGHFSKVQVISYEYNIQIKWITYWLVLYIESRSGYAKPEDIVLSKDGTHAYVTERVGTLLRVDLNNAGRENANVVSSGMTAPHQIALDEDRGDAYVVEYANPGRLLRIDLATGAQTVLYNSLEWAIGLLITQDLRFAYVSEQAGPGNGRVSRIELSSKTREELVSGLTAPFFLTWSDPSGSGIMTTERDPANRVTLINLVDTPVSVSHILTNVPWRPSSVAIMKANHLLVCSDGVISGYNLTESIFVPTGPIIMGIGHVPVDRILNGYADTTADPGYFFQVRDSPFGGNLSLMINHVRAYGDGARWYKVYMNGQIQKDSWSDYLWSNSQKRFILDQNNAQPGGYFRVRRPQEVWYNHWLGYRLNTTGFPNGLHTVKVELYSAMNLASKMSTHQLQLKIDNSRPMAAIDEIIHDGTVVGTCGIVDSGSEYFTFRITAHDTEGHLRSWQLVSIWGDNKSKPVANENYIGQGVWHGFKDTIIPSSPWHAIVQNDPTSLRCAHTFYLNVWDRVINGYNYIHHSDYHKSITLML